MNLSKSQNEAAACVGVSSGTQLKLAASSHLSLMLPFIRRGSSCIARHLRSGASVDCMEGASTSFSQSSHQTARSYSAEAQANTAVIGNERVNKLASEIIELTVLESSWLSEILRKKLNIQRPAYGAMPMAMQAAPAAPAAAADAAPPPPAPAKEKTEFEVRLESFSAEGKIKVIKELRAITNLGLKEAKDLCEKAPVAVKANVPKAEAEAMKKQIEAAGGKVTLA